jgi:hypothetical protein
VLELLRLVRRPLAIGQLDGLGLHDQAQQNKRYAGQPLHHYHLIRSDVIKGSKAMLAALGQAGMVVVVGML